MRLIDVRHAASSAFEDIKVGQVPKSRRLSSEPHNLRAAWAKRRSWRIFTSVFVAHGTKCPWDRKVVRSGQRQRLRINNGELTNKQKNWYRIRVFGDDRHRDDLPRGETCIPRIYAGRTGSMRKWSRRSERDAATRFIERTRPLISAPVGDRSS